VFFGFSVFFGGGCCVHLHSPSDACICFRLCLCLPRFLGADFRGYANACISLCGRVSCQSVPICKQGPYVLSECWSVQPIVP